MLLRFETCDRERALGFLRKFYPSRALEDTAESAGPVLDLVAKDAFRIPDPDHHGGAIHPGKNWDQHPDALAVLTDFHNKHK